MRGYRARRDSNHADIVAAFRQLGCSWLDLAAVGQGCPDGLVGYGGLSVLVEIKDGSKPPSKRALTQDQREFHNSWTGGLRLVASIADAVTTAYLLRRWHVAIVRENALLPAVYVERVYPVFNS